MISYISEDFIKCFNNLPGRIKERARKCYMLWRDNPNHPSLEFKRVSRKQPVYSARIGLGWRTLCIKKDNYVIWFWIGSHADYDKIIDNL